MTTSYTEKVRRIRSTSLIAYWPLDENDGTVAWDWGKNAYNAVLQFVDDVTGAT